MFTGLVECTGQVVQAAPSAADGMRLTAAAPFAGEVAIGDSVAINGCCLTAVALGNDQLEFDVGPETLRLTNLGLLQRGMAVNLERPLRVGDRLGGHIVQGHIDGLAVLLERRKVDEWEFLRFDAGKLIDYLVPKGSIAVDGVSLTIVDVVASTFGVMIVPHTAQVTTLGTMAIGAMANLEVDILGKYVVDYLNRIHGKRNS